MVSLIRCSEPKPVTARHWVLIIRLHWLVVNIPGHDVAKGQSLVDYVSSAPPKGSGMHCMALPTRSTVCVILFVLLIRTDPSMLYDLYWLISQLYCGCASSVLESRSTSWHLN